MATAAIAISIIAFLAIPRQQQLESRGKDWFGTILHDMKDGLHYLRSWKGMVVLTVIALVFKMAAVAGLLAHTAAGLPAFGR